VVSRCRAQCVCVCVCARAQACVCVCSLSQEIHLSVDSFTMNWLQVFTADSYFISAVTRLILTRCRVCVCACVYESVMCLLCMETCSLGRLGEFFGVSIKSRPRIERSPVFDLFLCGANSPEYAHQDDIKSSENSHAINIVIYANDMNSRPYSSNFVAGLYMEADIFCFLLFSYFSWYFEYC
jgi:hypothetical protein